MTNECHFRKILTIHYRADDFLVTWPRSPHNGGRFGVILSCARSPVTLSRHTLDTNMFILWWDIHIGTHRHRYLHRFTHLSFLGSFSSTGNIGHLSILHFGNEPSNNRSIQWPRPSRTRPSVNNVSPSGTADWSEPPFLVSYSITKYYVIYRIGTGIDKNSICSQILCWINMVITIVAVPQRICDQ